MMRPRTEIIGQLIGSCLETEVFSLISKEKLPTPKVCTSVASVSADKERKEEEKKPKSEKLEPRSCLRFEALSVLFLHELEHRRRQRSNVATGVE
jgi:hypothetical protein